MTNSVPRYLKERVMTTKSFSTENRQTKCVINVKQSNLSDPGCLLSTVNNINILKKKNYMKSYRNSQSENNKIMQCVQIFFRLRYMNKYILSMNFIVRFRFLKTNNEIVARMLHYLLVRLLKLNTSIIFG